MANSLFDYLGDEELFNRNTQNKDDPIKRRTPSKIKSPFGTMKITSKSVFQLNNRLKAGTIVRFNYVSVNRPGYTEHDKHPFVILLTNPGGKVFYKSKTERHLGGWLFHGINLNYLKDEAMAIMLEALVIQNITKGPPSYDLLSDFDAFIPEQAFRKYYVKGTKSPKLLKAERNGN